MAYQGEANPTKIVVTIGNPIGALGAAVAVPGFASLSIASGRAPDSFVTAARSEDTFTIVVGADGDATHVRSQNKSGPIGLVLMIGSGFNTALSILQLAQENEIIPDFTFPVTVTDQTMSPPSVVFGSNCKITRPADFERGASEGNNTWTFMPDKLSIVHIGRAF